MDLKGTKTEANLKAAFAGESQARNKYTYFQTVDKHIMGIPSVKGWDFFYKKDFSLGCRIYKV
jgi:hypothetical protein